jgi:hypothetical protein
MRQYNQLFCLGLQIWISEMLQYYIACGFYQDFLDRGLLLTRKLLNQGFLLVMLKSSLRKFSMICWTAMGYLCHNWPRICSTCRKPGLFLIHDFITGFLTRLTWRVPLVEQELPTIPGHLSSLPVFSGVRVTRSLVLYVCFVDRCLSFCLFFFWSLCCLHCFVTQISHSGQANHGKLSKWWLQHNQEEPLIQ